MIHSTSLLQNWLNSATLGIGRIGKHRIESEISAHYEQAYREALDAGYTENEAETNAVNALGNPEKARKGFRKTHLSKREEEHYSWQVRDIYKKEHRWAWLWICWGIAILIIFRPTLSSLNEDLFINIMLPYVLIFEFGLNVIWKYRYLEQRQLRKAFLLPCFLSTVIVYPMMTAWIISFMGSSEGAWKIVGLISILMTLRIVKDIRIFRKVPKEVSNDEMYILQTKPL